MRRPLSVLAASVAVALVVAAPVAAARTQPTLDVPANSTVVDIAPQPSSMYLVGYHGDCGHGCNWDQVPLVECAPGQSQAVAITNTTPFDTFVKRYWDPRRLVTPRGTSGWLTYEAICVVR